MQLRNVCNLSAIIAGFALVAFLEFQYTFEVSFRGFFQHLIM